MQTEQERAVEKPSDKNSAKRREWVKPEFSRIELTTAAGIVGIETPTDSHSNT